MSDEQKRVILQAIAQAKTTSHAWDAVNSILSTHAASAPNPSDKQEAVGYQVETSMGWVDAGDKWLAFHSQGRNVRKLYAAPFAQSAEQDRIDAERYAARYKWLREHHYTTLTDEQIDASIDAAIAKERT